VVAKRSASRSFTVGGWHYICQILTRILWVLVWNAGCTFPESLKLLFEMFSCVTQIAAEQQNVKASATGKRRAQSEVTVPQIFVERTTRERHQKALMKLRLAKLLGGLAEMVAV
jgi:hypothetical protein